VTPFNYPEKLSKKDLKIGAMRCLEMYNKGVEVGISREGFLLDSQFYIAELDRRHDSFISIRDFLLELVVILLIGWEIVMGYQQDKAMVQMQSSMERQAAILENIEKSFNPPGASKIIR
jgi:hypothetical protein